MYVYVQVLPGSVTFALKHDISISGQPWAKQIQNLNRTYGEQLLCIVLGVYDLW